MGCVYEAADSGGNKVALKMMKAEVASMPDYKGLFYHEAESLRVLSHPCVVRILEEPFSDEKGNLFLAMEFVEGKTISQIVKENGPYSETEALSLFAKLLDVFAYIHSRGCIHRDVKPANIMIRPDGSVCVIDFGIAKDSKTRTGKTIGTIVGTDGYMSPEQANGYHIDTRTDIYSLGCLLHYMLTGAHAIVKQSNDYDTVCTILENKFPLVADKGIVVSDRTQQAILTAVDKNMTLRYQTADEFKTALVDGSSYKVTVGRSNCDITLYGEYVSGKHLDITWVPKNEMGNRYEVKITDHSTNGTGVNGKKINHESYTFVVEKSVKALMKDCSPLPQVMIAGLADYMLNWVSVLNVLYDKMGLPTSVLDDDIHENNDVIVVYPPPSLPDPVPDKITAICGVLCFLVPVAGWILGYVWKRDTPVRAASANKLAWFGFLFNCVLYILTLNL